MHWPIIELTNLFHVGFLKKELKNPNSYEGSGLSVSTTPAAWRQINRKTNGYTYQCIKPNNQFLDYYALTPTQKEVIIAWGLRHQWIEPQPVYRVCWFDDELDGQVYMDFTDKQDAIEQNNDTSDENLLIMDGYMMTDNMQTAVHYTTREINPIGLLATLYCEKVLSIDGVWWNESLDVSRYSAPRGVISNTKWHEWHYTKID